MIYADCFIKSEKCRAVEFVPSEGDIPIVQFAAKNAEDFAGAAELVYGLVYSNLLLIYFKIVRKNLFVRKFCPQKNFFSVKIFFLFSHCQGIDLNCGCPKRDVRSEGFGSKLLDDPQLIFDIVRQCRRRISDENFSISIKIRLKKSLEETVDLCRKVYYFLF